MLREKTGGTEMWCSNCEILTVCKAISPKEVDYELESGRRCLNCGIEFITSEIREDFVDELIELREALGEIKKNAEKYIKESESASNSLKKLSRSLNVLRALSIYQSQNEVKDQEDFDFDFDEDNEDSDSW